MGLWSIIVNGVETNFDAFGFYIQAPLGAGMPDPQNVTQPYAVLDGAQFQRARVPPRVLTLKGTLVGSSLSDLHTKRHNLIAAVRRDNRDPQTPITLKYTGGTVNPVYLDGYYESGLQLGERRGFSEQIGLRFLCTNPLWYGAAANQALTVQTSFSAYYVLRQAIATGAWATLPSTSLIYQIAALANGDLLIIGALGVMRWNGSALTTLASSASVYSGVEAATGDIYAGGTFTTLGGTAANGVARWNGSAWSALGGGITGGAHWVIALAVGADGTLYAGGLFTAADGMAVSNIAKWNGLTWSALGSGISGKSGRVNALAIGPDGTLYAGGDFTTAGGNPASNVAKWNGTSWSALGSGVTGGMNYVNALAIGPDGALYVGGDFTTAGGNPASNIARWNGTSWSALGSGANAVVRALSMAGDGILYAGGDFTAAGGVPCPDAAARWNGFAWFPLDVNLPGAGNIAGVATTATYRYIGSGGSSGTAIAAGVTTATNVGSAATSPTITVTGAGRLYQIVNITTGAGIYFNLDILAGETITINTTQKTVTSSYRGNLLRAVLPGSQLGRFALLPGANSISLYHASGTATATMSWTNRYWSLDG